MSSPNSENADRAPVPKVLIATISAWRGEPSLHTLMNVFSCWDPEKIAVVYTRADLPQTDRAARFFQISESAVLRSVFRPWRKVGKETPALNAEQPSAEAVAERQRYAKSGLSRTRFLNTCREIVWLLGRWKSPKLRQFVDSFEPDLLFFPLYPTIYMGRLQQYLAKMTGKPFVCYMFDDNYSYASCKSPIAYIHRFFLRRKIRWLCKNCRELFVIVDKQKEEVDSLFGVNSHILTKGVRVDPTLADRPVKRPLRFVYTGNLLIGRGESLALVADQLNELNTLAGRELATLEIYSGTQLPEELDKRLNRGSVRRCGFVPRSEVARIQCEADVALFVEALEGRKVNTARLSFSTKITDYLGNGKCILAVGKESFAPLAYFRKYDAALTACSAQELRAVLTELLERPEIVLEYQKKALRCAKLNHDKDMMDERFLSVMRSALDRTAQ
ncbi:MAG: hypothetical protein Q4G03_10170 [Planctomycetia bacterium]|nr:hypothetical protein [Planctomycetia bacterium]